MLHTVIKENVFRKNSSDNAGMKDGLQFFAIRTFHMEGKGERQVYKNHNFWAEVDNSSYELSRPVLSVLRSS